MLRVIFKAGLGEEFLRLHLNESFAGGAATAQGG
jgi:hypothetical protein